MKPLPLILLVFAAVALLSGCSRKKDAEEQRLSWSTESPLSIPYHTRFQRLEKKNLVRNHSFETGRTFTLDSTKTSFVIDGWQQVGQHVEWVDTRNDSLYQKDEALSGYRAVKITRKQAYETEEQGEGIISDFIKVIPGNYSLSFYTRLKNIFPVKGRLGIKMFDAVNVRLLYFDRNKIVIGPEQFFPQQNQYIDNSFKSLSLANFSAIPSFGWGKIIGKSAGVPFFDGDVPTVAHYVKIFIGLKSTGIMWIDSVQFSYTKKNFSVEERMLAYTDTTFHVQPIIIPTPKKMQRMESVVISSADGRHGLPIIVVPDMTDNLTLQAAELLRKALSENLAGTIGSGSSTPDIRIVKAGNEQLPDDSKLIFVLGSTGLFSAYQKDLPFSEINGHPQGYFISTPRDLSRVVFLGGNNSIGVYYAALSAVQLIDGHQPVYHMARIIDYPDFENRYYTLGEMHDTAMVKRYARLAREMEACKMNGAFYFLNGALNSAAGNTLQTFGKLMEQPGLFGIACVSPGKLNDTAHFFSYQVYAPQRMLPNDSTLCYSFPVNLASPGEIDVISPKGQPVNSLSQPALPGPLLLHPVNNNQLLDYSLYSSMTVRDFSMFTFLYSGSSFFSVNTDDADFARFHDFSHSKPVFMDNSMLISSPWGQFGGAYPFYSGKIRLFNIFEPFMDIEIREHLNQLDTSLFWVNYSPTSEIDLIRLSTAAEFMWNTRNYDPEYSTWRVLLSRYGVTAARMMIHYADQYGLMLEIVLKLERKEQLPRSLKNIQSDWTYLTSVTSDLKQLLGPGHPLIHDILILNESLKDRIDRIQNSKDQSLREKTF